MDDVLLLCFCNKYLPGTSDNFSATFTSKQIKHIIKEHTDTDIDLKELNTHLQSKGYDYELVENEFTWLCIKN